MQADLRHEIDITNNLIFKGLQFEAKVEQYFKEQYPDGMPADAQFLYEEFLKLRQTREKLQATVKTDTTGAKTSALKTLSEELLEGQLDLEHKMEALCNKNPRFCE